MASSSAVLHVSQDDYCVAKAAMTSSYSKIPLVIKKGQTHESLLAMHTDAKSMVLQTQDGSVITQHLSILRYLADLAPTSNLFGTSAFDVSQVEQWLQFTWQQLGE